MKKLILHLGLQKTGSTSIQETFQWNPEPLARAGFVYGHVDWPNGEINSNHSFPMIAAFGEGWESHEEVLRRGWSPEGLKAHFLGQVMQMLDTDRNLILSGEDITDLQGPGLAAFSDLAREKGFALCPVMFIRSPLEYITSMSQTRIRHGYAFHLFDAARSRRIEPCLKLWPEMACIPFALALQHPDGPLGMLLERYGLPPASAFEVIRQNESLSDHATRIIGHVNGQVPLYLDGAVNPQRSYLDTEPLVGIVGPRFRLTRSEFLKVRELVQRENEAFARLLGPEFCDPSFRFTDRPEPWSAPALAELARAMAALAPGLQEAIRGYFHDGSLVTAEEAALAARILGQGEGPAPA